MIKCPKCSGTMEEKFQLTASSYCYQCLLCKNIEEVEPSRIVTKTSRSLNIRDLFKKVVVVTGNPL